MLPEVARVTTCSWFRLSQASLAWEVREEGWEEESLRPTSVRSPGTRRQTGWGLCHPTARPEGHSGAAVQPVPKGFLFSAQ